VLDPDEHTKAMTSILEIQPEPMRWRAVDLATNWLTMHGSKSDEADRRVKDSGRAT
jgi:hypothetical protein